MAVGAFLLIDSFLRSCGSIFAVVVETMGKSVKYVVVTVLALCLACGLRAQGQETVSGGVRIQERDAASDSLRLRGMDSRMPVPVFHPMFLPPDAVGGNLEWAASRPLEVGEILARDRKLLLTRMINDSGMPRFMLDLRSEYPAVYSIMAIIVGMLGGAGGFLGGSPMEMLVPKPVVGGQPWFDDMIFLGPNFDPRIYRPSLPVPQYDPENPSQPYKASLRESGDRDIGDIPVRGTVSSGPTGPPPVQKSRYVVP